MAFKRSVALLENKWRWDLGDYAVKGIQHVDCFGAYNGGGKQARAGIAGGAYKPYRDTYQATHTPHFKAMAHRGSPEHNRRIFEEHFGNHIGVPVTARKFTREELETAEAVAAKNKARRAYHASVPLLSFYLETNWKARFSRQYEKAQAEQDIRAQVRRSLPPKAQAAFDERAKLIASQ